MGDTMTRELRRLGEVAKSAQFEAFLYGLASSLDLTGTTPPGAFADDFEEPDLLDRTEPEAQLNASWISVGESLVVAIYDEREQQERAAEASAK